MPKAFININLSPRDDGSGGHDIKIDTDLTSEDDLTVMLLLTVENLTGVSTNAYVATVDAMRRQGIVRGEADLNA